MANPTFPISLIWNCMFLAFQIGVVFSSRRTEYFDLSYSINNDTIYFPGQKVEFALSKDINGYMEAGYWYASYSFCMGEHGGTHVDAPIHFSVDGWTLDEIPSTSLIDVPATVINIEKKVFVEESNPYVDYTLSVKDLIHHEAIHGRIPSKGVLLIHTGWARYWPDKLKYLGYRNSTPEVYLHFPGCSEEAAKWLANERGIVGLGIDTPSVDPGNSKALPVHILFAKRRIYNIENVANLHLLLKNAEESRSCNLRLFVLHMKITGGTGGPARVLAYCKN